MLTQKLTVSRKQGVVQCLADGTATLTSEGKGPTLWREHAAMSNTRSALASAQGSEPTRVGPPSVRRNESNRAAFFTGAQRQRMPRCRAAFTVAQRQRMLRGGT
jgi:hypothetical protein